ncbi:hypothetical protein SUNI508_13406 [Seiridium unicorne]|uniref:Uncharacterized protein n=1 Tax=Seiridium unicorne TaxID=138068 RepID=A0ABR2VD45_9PEZI
MPVDIIISHLLRDWSIAVVSGGSANGSLLRASTSRANGSDDAPPRIVVVTVGAMVDPINAGVGGRDSTDPSLRLDDLLCLIKHIAKTRATRTATASGMPRPMASLPEEESPEPESLVLVVARLARVDCELAVMVTREVTVADVGTAEGADADVGTDEADADAGTDVDPDAAVVVVAADVVGPSLLVKYSCTSLGKEVNQLGFFPSRNSDHKMAETSGRFVAAICLNDEGIPVKRASAKDSLLSSNIKRTYGSRGADAAADLASRCASNDGADVIKGGGTSFKTRQRDKTAHQF